MQNLSYRTVFEVGFDTDEIILLPSQEILLAFIFCEDFKIHPESVIDFFGISSETLTNWIHFAKNIQFPVEEYLAHAHLADALIRDDYIFSVF